MVSTEYARGCVIGAGVVLFRGIFRGAGKRLIMPRPEDSADESGATYMPEPSQNTGYSQARNPNDETGPAASNSAPSAPQHKNLGALREIPIFEPEKEGGVSVTDFLEAVGNAASLGNLEPNDIMRVMPMRLRGPAKGFWRTFLASRPIGANPETRPLGYLWPEFKTGLKDRFCKPTDPVAHLMKLTGCQQGDTETARGYAQRVRMLAFKTWPQFTQSQDEATRRMGESLIYQHFLKGLKPNNIERIHLKGIRDMDTAVLELTNKETFDALQRAAGRPVRVNLIGGEEGDRSEVDDLREAVKDLRATVSAHMAETAELLRAHATATLPTPGSYAEAEGCDPYGMSYAAGASEIQGATGGGYEPYGQPGADPYPSVNAVGYGPYGGAPPPAPPRAVSGPGYRPRLPQFPILQRPPAPRGLAPVPFRSAAPVRAPVACYNCRGPHMVRDCPSLVRPGAGGYQTNGPAGGMPGRYVARPEGLGANYPVGVRPPGAPAARGGNTANQPALNW